MLAVQAEHRGRGIGAPTVLVTTDHLATELVESALTAMVEKGADEVVAIFVRTHPLQDLFGDRDDESSRDVIIREYGLHTIQTTS